MEQEREELERELNMRKLIFVTASFCGPCHTAKRYLFEPVINARKEHVVLYDAQLNAVECTRLGVRRVPAVFFVEDDGSIVGRCSTMSKLSVQGLINWLDSSKDKKHDQSDTKK